MKIALEKAIHKMGAGDTFVAGGYKLTLTEGGGFTGDDGEPVRLNVEHLRLNLYGVIVKAPPKALDVIGYLKKHGYGPDSFAHDTLVNHFDGVNDNGRLERDIEIRPAIDGLWAAQEKARRDKSLDSKQTFVKEVGRILNAIPLLQAAPEPPKQPPPVC